jgi:hypothetical protein
MIRAISATALGLLFLGTLSAQTSAPAPAPSASVQPVQTSLPSTHEHFPDDYKRTACAPRVSCRSFDLDKLTGAAKSFLGLKLAPEWVEAHSAELLESIGPICEKHASCIGTLGNSFLFCDDVVTPELRDICDRRFPQSKSARDSDQCRQFVEIYALGVDSNAMKIWRSAQECAATVPRMTGTMDVWIEPSTISPDNKGYITFYALDTSTHIPVAAEVGFLNEILVDPANPTGTVATYYPFKYRPKFRRIANAEGHTDLAPSLVTIESPYYPKVTMNLPVKVPQMIVEMNPPASQLKPGHNTVTISARDADSGKPVEARVMIGDRWGGETNKPFTLDVPRGAANMPEVWVTSLFDRYSDHVVVPKPGTQTIVGRH